VTTTTPAVRRWYVRCADCLSIGAVETSPPAWRVEWDYIRKTPDDQFPEPVARWVGGWTCDGCGGRIESMGEVFRGYVANRAQVAICDHRCTGARGPKCECECGGQYHGTGATVEVHQDAAGVPRCCVLDRSESMQRAAQFRAAWAGLEAAHQARFGDLDARKARRDWLEPSEFSEWRVGSQFRGSMREAKGLRTHAGRQKAIARLTASIREGRDY